MVNHRKTEEEDKSGSQKEGEKVKGKSILNPILWNASMYIFHRVLVYCLCTLALDKACVYLVLDPN